MDKLSRTKYLAFILGLAIDIPLAIAFFLATISFYRIFDELISSLVLKAIITFMLGLLGFMVSRWAGKKISSLIAIESTSESEEMVYFPGCITLRLANILWHDLHTPVSCCGYQRNPRYVFI